MKDQYRQGDVLLIKVGQLPPGSAKEEAADHRIVLAWGEVTGHAHAVSAATATYYKFGGGNYLQVHEDTKLVHEEHRAIDLPVGVYKIVLQREYFPAGNRVVVD
ncbi:MAG: hypothetical protein U0105_12515 [Candidatus Obscuribacterales bacterium]